MRCSLPGCENTVPSPSPLLGDDLYVVDCGKHGRAAEVTRPMLNWMDAVHLILRHLSLSRSHSMESPLFFSIDEICTEFLAQVSVLYPQGKELLPNWTRSVTNMLCFHTERFVSGFQVTGIKNTWALRDIQVNVSELYWSGKTLGRIKRPNKKRTATEQEGQDSATTQGVVDDKSERKEDTLSIFPDLYNEKGDVRMSTNATHSAILASVSSDNVISNDAGYVTCKASHGTSKGTYYFEIRILEPKKLVDKRYPWNCRLGIAQISADLQIPCGADVFGYAWRANPGTLFHQAIGKSIVEGYDVGDVLGFLLHIPEPLPDVYEEDLKQRVWKPVKRYQPIPYTWSSTQEGAMPKMEASQLVLFKNGLCLGPVFLDLFLGKYYPAISCFNGGRVQVGFGPEFQCSMPKTWNGVDVKPWSELVNWDIDPTEHVTACEQLNVDGQIVVSDADGGPVRSPISVDR